MLAKKAKETGSIVGQFVDIHTVLFGLHAHCTFRCNMYVSSWSIAYTCIRISTVCREFRLQHQYHNDDTSGTVTQISNHHVQSTLPVITNEIAIQYYLDRASFLDQIHHSLFSRSARLLSCLFPPWRLVVSSLYEDCGFHHWTCIDKRARLHCRPTVDWCESYCHGPTWS